MKKQTAGQLTGGFYVEWNIEKGCRNAAAFCLLTKGS